MRLTSLHDDKGVFKWSTTSDIKSFHSFFFFLRISGCVFREFRDFFQICCVINSHRHKTQLPDRWATSKTPRLLICCIRSESLSDHTLEQIFNSWTHPPPRNKRRNDISLSMLIFEARFLDLMVRFTARQGFGPLSLYLKFTYLQMWCSWLTAPFQEASKFNYSKTSDPHPQKVHWLRENWTTPEQCSQMGSPSLANKPLSGWQK